MIETKRPTAVLKFGGAAFGDEDAFDRIASLVEQMGQKYQILCIVTSAMAGVTNDLLQRGKRVSLVAKEARALDDAPVDSWQEESRCVKRELDLLISTGERISASLLAIALSRHGLKAQSFTGSQAGIITTTVHQEAQIIDLTPRRLEESMAKGHIPVVAGFQGVSLQKEVTTLGRGGSDISAIALAIALEADRVCFFKDVSHLFTENPKEAKGQPKPFKNLSYKEAKRLMQRSHYALHPRAINLASQHALPIDFGSFADAQNYPGTIIGEGGPRRILETKVYEETKDAPGAKKEVLGAKVQDPSLSSYQSLS